MSRLRNSEDRGFALEREEPVADTLLVVEVGNVRSSTDYQNRKNRFWIDAVRYLTSADPVRDSVSDVLYVKDLDLPGDAK